MKLNPNPYPALSEIELQALCKTYHDCQQYIDHLPQTLEKQQLSVVLSFAGIAICETLYENGRINADDLRLLMPQNKYFM